MSPTEEWGRYLTSVVTKAVSHCRMGKISTKGSHKSCLPLQNGENIYQGQSQKLSPTAEWGIYLPRVVTKAVSHCRMGEISTKCSHKSCLPLQNGGNIYQLLSQKLSPTAEWGKYLPSVLPSVITKAVSHSRMGEISTKCCHKSCLTLQNGEDIYQV